jgi:hypothetical protein
MKHNHGKMPTKGRLRDSNAGASPPVLAPSEHDMAAVEQALERSDHPIMPIVCEMLRPK